MHAAGAPQGAVVGAGQQNTHAGVLAPHSHTATAPATEQHRVSSNPASANTHSFLEENLLEVLLWISGDEHLACAINDSVLANQPVAQQITERDFDPLAWGLLRDWDPVGATLALNELLRAGAFSGEALVADVRRGIASLQGEAKTFLAPWLSC